MTEPTLLELLESAALDASDSATRFRKLGAKEAGTAVLDEFAARLRAAAERLRDEMESAVNHSDDLLFRLEHINGGPLAAPSSAPCGTCGGMKRVPTPKALSSEPWKDSNRCPACAPPVTEKRCETWCGSAMGFARGIHGAIHDAEVHGILTVDPPARLSVSPCPKCGEGGFEMWCDGETITAQCARCKGPVEVPFAPSIAPARVFVMCECEAYGGVKCQACIEQDKRL